MELTPTGKEMLDKAMAHNDEISCDKCDHKDVCKWYEEQIIRIAQRKQLGLKIPLKAEDLAKNCDMFQLKATDLSKQLYRK